MKKQMQKIIPMQEQDQVKAKQITNLNIKIHNNKQTKNNKAKKEINFLILLWLIKKWTLIRIDPNLDKGNLKMQVHIQI